MDWVAVHYVKIFFKQVEKIKMTLNEMAKESGFYDDCKLSLRVLCEELELDDFEFADITKFILCDGRKVIRDCWLDNMNVERLIEIFGERLVRRYSIDIDHSCNEIEIYVEVE